MLVLQIDVINHKKIIYTFIHYILEVLKKKSFKTS